MTDLWSRLSADPREPQSGALRATDHDRDEILALLRESYADGRLTRAEHDERRDAVLDTRTLGEFVPLLTDLLPAVPATRRPAATDLHSKAVQKYERELANARNGWIFVSVMTLGTWAATSIASSGAYFFWPIFPILGVGIGWFSLRLNRDDRIESIEENIADTRRTTREPE